MERSEEIVSLHFRACMVFEGIVQSKATETLDSNKFPAWQSKNDRCAATHSGKNTAFYTFFQQSM